MALKQVVVVYVEVSVYKDEVSVYPNGCTRAVSGDSIVFDVQKIYLYDYPLGCDETPLEYKMLLKIIDPQYGILWIDETAQSFADKIAIAASTPSASLPHYMFTIGDGGANTPIDGSDEYNNTALAGATSLKVEKNGYGTLRPATQPPQEYTILPVGGFSLAVAGGTFSTGETYFVWKLT